MALGQFGALGIPLKRGRDFNDGDAYDAPLTAVINEALARKAYPGQDPLGHMISCGLDSDKPMRIVGIVGDVRQHGPADVPSPEIYMPYDQHTGSAGTSLSVLVRTASAPETLEQTLRRKAISSLEREALLGTFLAGLMILLFIGSFRSTAAILRSIPLSILAAIIGLFFTDNSLNLMTLGGLALAVGRLVDDSIVVLENTHRHLAMGKTAEAAALDAAEEVRMPILVATITTVGVFAPGMFLSGIGRALL